ncbi:unnamed protein product, partial [Mesorhabditis spiculigera]
MGAISTYTFMIPAALVLFVGICDFMGYELAALWEACLSFFAIILVAANCVFCTVEAQVRPEKLGTAPYVVMITTGILEILFWAYLGWACYLQSQIREKPIVLVGIGDDGIASSQTLPSTRSRSSASGREKAPKLTRKAEPSSRLSSGSSPLTHDKDSDHQIRRSGSGKKRREKESGRSGSGKPSRKSGKKKKHQNSGRSAKTLRTRDPATCNTVGATLNSPETVDTEGRNKKKKKKVALDSQQQMPDKHEPQIHQLHRQVTAKTRKKRKPAHTKDAGKSQMDTEEYIDNKGLNPLMTLMSPEGSSPDGRKTSGSPETNIIKTATKHAVKKPASPGDRCISVVTPIQPHEVGISPETAIPLNMKAPTPPGPGLQQKFPGRPPLFVPPRSPLMPKSPRLQTTAGQPLPFQAPARPLQPFPAQPFPAQPQQVAIPGQPQPALSQPRLQLVAQSFGVAVRPQPAFPQVQQQQKPPRPQQPIPFPAQNPAPRPFPSVIAVPTIYAPPKP